nr:mechanosensitive ion channel domain-containing protein [uncultured Carboxylicivirga sp.]
MSKNYYVLTSVSILFLLIAVPFFFLIRDFVSGLFLKLQNKLFEGMSIEIEDVKGVVKKNGIFRLDIEDKYGNINSVSYYKIRSKIITRPKVSYNLEKTTLEFIFQEASNTNRILAELKRQLMNIPWVAVRQPPLIENTRVENGKFIVEIGVYMLDKSYAENIKHSVESNMLTM